MKVLLSATAMAYAIFTSVVPAMAANPRLASSPAGDAMCVHADSTAVWAHNNSDPLTQAWSAGTSISLPLPEGKIVHLSDVAYAGNGRYVACWILSPNQVVSAYTDGGGVWSNPAVVGELLPNHTASALRIAADSTGNVMMFCSGQASYSSYGLYVMRSVNSGESFTAPELQGQNDDNYPGVGATVATLMTNGAGAWYRASTRLFQIGGLTPFSYSASLQSSWDAGLSWSAWVGITGSLNNSKMLMGGAAFANRACMLSYYGDTMVRGKLTFTQTDNNGASWTNSTFPVDEPYFFGPLDYPNYLNTEAEIATDAAGNSVVVYKARYTGAGDTDLLSFRSADQSYTNWNTDLTYVSRQVDRNESGIALTTLGENKFLTAYDINDAQNPAVAGIQTVHSTDAGVTWSTGPVITGNVAPGDLREYEIPEEPQPPVKFTINSVTPKIKYKEPKPGKEPKPRKATFKVVIGTTENLTNEEFAIVKVYLSNDSILQIEQDQALYSGSTKYIKPGKSGKLTIKFQDFPDPTGKYVLIQVYNGEPYVIPF